MLPIFVSVVVTIFTDGIGNVLDRGRSGTTFLCGLARNVYLILSPSREAKDPLPTKRYQDFLCRGCLQFACTEYAMVRIKRGL